MVLSRTLAFAALGIMKSTATEGGFGSLPLLEGDFNLTASWLGDTITVSLYRFTMPLAHDFQVVQEHPYIREKYDLENAMLEADESEALRALFPEVVKLTTEGQTPHIVGVQRDAFVGILNKGQGTGPPVATEERTWRPPWIYQVFVHETQTIAGRSGDSWVNYMVGRVRQGGGLHQIVAFEILEADNEFRLRITLQGDIGNWSNITATFALPRQLTAGWLKSDV